MHREKSSGRTHLFTIWTIGDLDRTSGQPQVKMNLLRSISLKIRPQDANCDKIWGWRCQRGCTVMICSKSIMYTSHFRNMIYIGKMLSVLSAKASFLRYLSLHILPYSFPMVTYLIFTCFMLKTVHLKKIYILRKNNTNMNTPRKNSLSGWVCFNI